MRTWYRCLFFCSQKTAYEMRISDWCSDVFSSDLVRALLDCLEEPRGREGRDREEEAEAGGRHAVDATGQTRRDGRARARDPGDEGEALDQADDESVDRTEERLAGKVCASTWRPR